MTDNEQGCAVDGCENLPVKLTLIQQIGLDDSDTVVSVAAEVLLCEEHEGVWGFMPKELVDKISEEAEQDDA
jgi:hypothetical protein